MPVQGGVHVVIRPCTYFCSCAQRMAKEAASESATVAALKNGDASAGVLFGESDGLWNEGTFVRSL